MDNIVTRYAAKSFPLCFLGILLSNHAFMFAVLQMVTLTKSTTTSTLANISPFMLYLPIAFLQCAVAFISIFARFKAGKVRLAFMTQKTQYANLSIWNILLIGFVYSFGYFIPTLELIRNELIKSTVSFVTLSLACDACFVPLFSGLLLQRNFFSKIAK